MRALLALWMFLFTADAVSFARPRGSLSDQPIHHARNGVLAFDVKTIAPARREPEMVRPAAVCDKGSCYSQEVPAPPRPSPLHALHSLLLAELEEETIRMEVEQDMRTRAPWLFEHLSSWVPSSSSMHEAGSCLWSSKSFSAPIIFATTTASLAASSLHRNFAAPHHIGALFKVRIPIRTILMMFSVGLTSSTVNALESLGEDWERKGGVRAAGTTDEELFVGKWGADQKNIEPPVNVLGVDGTELLLTTSSSEGELSQSSFEEEQAVAETGAGTPLAAPSKEEGEGRNLSCVLERRTHSVPR